MTIPATIEVATGALTEPQTGRRWDPATIDREADLRAALYRRQGVSPGDGVFLFHGNCLEFFVDLLALWSIGACAAPIDSRLTPFEIDTLVAAAEPRFALAREDVPEPLRVVLGARHVPVLDLLERPSAAHGPAGPGWRHAIGTRDADAAALLLFTSGTTGQPKGVVHTWRSLGARWRDLRASLGVAPFRRTLCLLPTHFGHGLICNGLYPWLSGCDLLILPPFQVDLIMELGRIVDEHGVTFLSSVPSMWHLALKTSRPPQKRSLERVICGSAPLSAALWERIRTWAGTGEVLNAYGITEAASWVAGTTVPGFVPEDGLIGVGWGTAIRILPAAGTDTPPADSQDVSRGAVGYIWLKTPGLMRGYLGRDDLTARVVRDGWLSTGDLGFVDRRGCLFLTGRDREEINHGGLKVYPADVEAIAERHEAVTEVCVFGYDQPIYGQAVGIALVMTRRDPANLRALYGLMTRHLAPHQLPERWYLVDALPRTSRGKVRRAAASEACAALTPIDLRGLLRAE